MKIYEPCPSPLINIAYSIIRTYLNGSKTRKHTEDVKHEGKIKKKS